MSVTVTTSPVLSVEDDLDKAWEKVIKRLEDEAELKLPADRRIDDIAAIINPPKADPTTKGEIKDVFAKALKCIDRFGGMIAQAGSIVFGPSTQIYNAVSFLVQVSQGVQEVFNNVTFLMKRLSVFLERLGLYLDRTGTVKLDYPMRKSMYRVLEHFVQVMVLSYKLTHRWKGKDGGWKGKVEAWKGKAKVIINVGAFGDDSGIKAAIRDFEQAVADVSDVQIDEIHRTLDAALLTLGSVTTTVQEIRTDTQDIRADTQEIRTTSLETAVVVEQLRGSDDEKKTESQIRKVIGFGEKEDLESVTRRSHDDYADQIVGTATWLLEEHYAFQRWKNVRGESDAKILMIQAPEGFGKSYLAHAIIEHLSKEIQRLEDPLTARVAWHYFQKDVKPTQVHQAVRYIIWQLSQADTAYAAFVKSASPLSNATGSETWSRLVMDYSTKRRPKSVFFIILDGIDRADQKTIKSLEDVVKSVSCADEPEGLRIRLLLTGNRDSLQNLQKQAGSSSTVVDLEPHQLTDRSDLLQRQDIEAFISEALGSIKLFQGTLSKEQQDLKAKILEKLPTAAPGDYNDLNRRLVEIRNSEEAGQIEELVMKVDLDSKRFITDQIHALNEQQSGPKIRQINEVLLWVSAANIDAQGKLLQSMIDLVFEGRGLINIVDIIRKDCNKLLELSGPDDDVAFKADAEEALQNAEPIRPTVNETEINMIQKMLQTSFMRTFGDLEIYQNFDFPRFFEEKRKVQNDLVHLPSFEQISLRALDTCLRAICDVQDSERTRPIRKYASVNFNDHLINIDIATVDKTVKAQMGHRIFRLLREEAVIDTWIDKDRTVHCFLNMMDWLSADNKFCDSVVAFLKDPEVEKSVQAVSTETDWLYKEDYEKVSKLKILQHVARRVLHRWYSDDYQDSSWPLMWMRAYSQRTGRDAESYNDKSPWDDCTAQELDRWEEWAMDTFGPLLDKSEWQLRMASACQTIAEWNTVDKHALFTRACARCIAAIELDPLKWKAHVLHGTILLLTRDYQGSITQLKMLKERPSSDDDDGYGKVYWEIVVPKLAQCYLNLEDHDAAIHWYHKALDHELDKDKKTVNVDEYACGIIKSLCRRGDTRQAVDYLDMLHQQSVEGKSWLRALLELPNSDVHDHIVALASETNTFDQMSGYYTAAIRDGGEDIKASGARTYMRFIQWRLHWFCNPTIERDAIIDGWESILDSTKVDEQPWTRTTRREVVRQLAHALFHLANQFELNSSEARVYMTRLEGICKKTEDLTGYTVSRDGNLVLARLLHLSGDDERARYALRTQVRFAIDQIRDEYGDPRWGYKSLAQIFPVLDDDEHAAAAWSLMEPNREDYNEKDAKGIGGIDAAVERDAPAGNEATVANDPSDPAFVPKEANIKAQATPPTTQDREPDQDPGTDSTATSEGSAGRLSGILGFVCDGRCDTDWPYAQEMYACKDCLCLQLCPDCYQKLQAGKLDVDICHKSHRHLHIPPFDVEAWRASDPKMVKVGDKWVAREAWVRQLEIDWDLHKWDMALRGIHRFKLWWLARKHRNSATAQTVTKDETKDQPEPVANNVAGESKELHMETEKAVSVPDVAVAA